MILALSRCFFPCVGPPSSNKGALNIGAILTPARASRLLLSAIVPLAVAACQTVRKPLNGFDSRRPGRSSSMTSPGAQ